MMRNKKVGIWSVWVKHKTMKCSKALNAMRQVQEDVSHKVCETDRSNEGRREHEIMGSIWQSAIGCAK